MRARAEGASQSASQEHGGGFGGIKRKRSEPHRHVLRSHEPTQARAELGRQGYLLEIDAPPRCPALEVHHGLAIRLEGDRFFTARPRAAKAQQARDGSDDPQHRRPRRPSLQHACTAPPQGWGVMDMASAGSRVTSAAPSAGGLRQVASASAQAATCGMRASARDVNLSVTLSFLDLF
jgi:hypothetical protein